MKPMTGKDILVAVVPLVAPLLTAAMGALGILAKDRRREKSLDHQLRRQVEIGQAEVKFIHAWIQARQLLGPLGMDSRVAQEWLDRCYESVEDAQRKVLLSPPKRIGVLRRLLLLRRLHGAGAQIWRIAFWLLFLWCNVYVVVGAANIVTWAQGKPGAGDTVLGCAVFAFILAAFAGAARIFSVYGDSEAQKPVAMPPHRPSHEGHGWPSRNGLAPHWPPRTPHDGP